MAKNYKKHYKNNSEDQQEIIDSNPRFYNSIGKNAKIEKIGRPTELTEDIIDTVVMALRSGAYVETAMNFVGVDRQRFYDWNKKAMEELKERDDALDKGVVRQPKNEIYVEFHNAIKKAMAESELLMLQVITNAANSGNWMAAAWRLERKHPDRYGINSLRISSGDSDIGQSKVEIQIVDQSDNKRIEEMEKAIIDEIKGS
jgi:hypothetical protein